ncbi:MAG: hypothetical protein H6R40_1652, partial [Gemmatimonadetes bacterium]|nr:hypothetical protein [Gemmatimonadota bacterium]
EAEFVRLGTPRMDDPARYAVIIDRISHEVPFYRTWLKHAALQGVTVINNPFMWSSDDKFFGGTLAASLGIAHPKTVLLPNKEYIPGIKHDESLRNLVFPLDWEGLVEYLGLPLVLKDAYGGGWRDVYICHSIDELLQHYNNSGQLTMIAQEFIRFEQFVRCICIGQEHILPIHYDPGEKKYHVDPEYLAPRLRDQIITESQALVRALGYDMNSIEWAIRDGIPYAIDFMNPAPDFDIHSLTPTYFEWAVQRMADLTIRLARSPRPAVGPQSWTRFLQGRMPRNPAGA